MKSRINFYLVFALILSLAGAVIYKNLIEYRKQNELQLKGVRTLGRVESCLPLESGKHVVNVRFHIEGKKYEVSKEVGSVTCQADSLPVYYLPSNPNINGIAAE